MGDEKKSGAQTLFTSVVSPETAGRMEAESRSWMIKCRRCGYERSAWSTGGVEYKASGTSYRYMRCPNCGKWSWNKVYRQATPQGPSGTIPGAATLQASLPYAAGSRGSTRWLLWLVLGVLGAGVLLGTGIFLLISTLTQPLATAGDNFMGALAKGNYAQAYALCTPDLQKKLPDVQGLTTLVGGGASASIDGGVGPAIWDWTGRSINNGVGQLSEPVTYYNGRAGTAKLELHQAGNDWKVASFSLSRP